MANARTKNTCLFLLMLMTVCMGFPQSGFSKDDMAGFHAGPLSVVAKTVVEKIKPVAEENLEPADKTAEAPQKIRPPKREWATNSEEQTPLSPPS